MTSPPLLTVTGAKKHFKLGSLFSLEKPRVIKAVDGVSFTVTQGETVGIVGESGCGKSTLARCIVGIHPPTEGTIQFEEEDLWEDDEYRPSARQKIQLVFQDQSSLDPRMDVRDIVTEPLQIHKATKQERTDRFADLMEMVQLDLGLGSKYPRELSGGQAQRVIIARALALNPTVLVADEPVSKLDVSVQAHILSELQEIKEQFDLTMIYISHDLATVEYLCDRLVVMYLGRLVETGSREILYESQHPYTRALVSAIPDQDVIDERILLPGSLPDPADIPEGCRFHTRCPYVKDVCRHEEPELEDRGNGQSVRCHFTPAELTLTEVPIGPEADSSNGAI